MIPPAILPGVGFPLLGFSPTRRKSISKFLIVSSSFLLTPSFSHRAARIRSAPIISGVSERITVPPSLTTRSLQHPTTGFAARPEVGSEPPHSVPKISSETGASSSLRRSASFRMVSANLTIRFTVCRLPPSSRITRTSKGLQVFLLISSARRDACTTSHPFPTRIVP